MLRHTNPRNPQTIRSRSLAAAVVLSVCSIALCSAQSKPAGSSPPSTNNAAFGHYTDSVNAISQAQNETHQMAGKLQLSADQIQKVQQINQSYYSQLNTMYRSAKSTTDVDVNKINAIEDTRTKALGQVLSSNQMTQYKSGNNK